MLGNFCKFQSIIKISDILTISAMVIGDWKGGFDGEHAEHIIFELTRGRHTEKELEIEVEI